MNLNCIIENKLYKLDRKMIDEILKMAKENYKTLNKKAIIGLEKEDTIDLKRIEFSDEKSMKKEIDSFHDLGFKVYYV